ncbi:hypothetical protein K458DRAFT_158862 [Lentithecium fluviatile CBS 122367]|uniref:Uncharacterized protein n=1 Tax=Lentithecium fluviatile CBS 122367 TaxID=1168545 RepID=A0A6G1IH37_9PLEO|nr:hypothetical protein K458DRAFT_158862 [Lentithecium fluviatile CBS 122367]
MPPPSRCYTWTSSGRLHRQALPRRLPWVALSKVDVEPASSAECITAFRFPGSALGCLTLLGPRRLACSATTATAISLRYEGTNGRAHLHMPSQL